MKYVSIDIETLGLEPKLHDIIEFGAVYDDLNNPLPLDQLPQFHAYFKKSCYRGDAYALSMHAEIFRKIAKPAEGDPVMPLGALMYSLHNWLAKIHYPFDEKKKTYFVNVAGKNAAGFDIPFLKEQIPGPWPGENYDKIYFKHRVIDVASHFFDIETDDGLPDMKTCLERVGIGGDAKHTAVEDALLVVQLVRKALLK